MRHSSFSRISSSCVGTLVRKRRSSTYHCTVSVCVPYVIVQGRKGAPAYEKSEDPIYVLENSLPIDTKYYLDNQLSKPLMRIFEPIMGAASQSLLKGDHTRKIFKATPSNTRGIMMFAVKKARCLGCKVTLGKGRTSLCVHCEPRAATLYRERLGQVSRLERKFSKLWTQCQRCQGSLHQDVLCTNNDCPIFYARKKVQKDLKDKQDVLDRFNQATATNAVCEELF